MKVGKLVNTNSKGQIVIPQEYRNLLGITPDVLLNITPKLDGIFIQLVEKVLPKTDSDDLYLEVLRSTRGAWGAVSANSVKKRKKELGASSSRKKKW